MIASCKAVSKMLTGDHKIRWLHAVWFLTVSLERDGQMVPEVHYTTHSSRFVATKKQSNSLSFSNDWYFTSYLQLIQLQLAETAIVNLAFDVLNNQCKSFED